MVDICHYSTDSICGEHMNNREDILLYAGYSAYITSHALSECGGFPFAMVKTEKESRDLTGTRCRWLIREFNNNYDNPGIKGKWKKMFSSLSNSLHVRVGEFDTITWDENIVLSYYRKIEEIRNLMKSLGDAVFAYHMDLIDVAELLGRTKNQLRAMIRYDIWVSESILGIVRKSLPVDEGFPLRFHIHAKKKGEGDFL